MTVNEIPCDEILEILESSMKLVNAANWMPSYSAFFIALECGHVVKCSEDFLRGRMQCVQCIEEKLQEKIK